MDWPTGGTTSAHLNLLLDDSYWDHLRQDGKAAMA